MRPYDLLVFDWDGTLVDSISSIVGCTQAALRQVGAAPLERAEPVALLASVRDVPAWLEARE